MSEETKHPDTEREQPPVELEAWRTECSRHADGGGCCYEFEDGPWMYCFECLLRLRTEERGLFQGLEKDLHAALVTRSVATEQCEEATARADRASASASEAWKEDAKLAQRLGESYEERDDARARAGRAEWLNLRLEHAAEVGDEILRKLHGQIQDLELTNSALVASNKALRGGDPEPSFCAYCLKCMPKGDAGAVVEHLLACPTHPVHLVTQENDQLRRKIAEGDELVASLNTQLKGAQSEIASYEDVEKWPAWKLAAAERVYE